MEDIIVTTKARQREQLQTLDAALKGMGKEFAATFFQVMTQSLDDGKHSIH
jgi:hypothetical protein